MNTLDSARYTDALTKRTGIRNADAAKRDLRRRFRANPIPPVVPRPGARFYVTYAGAGRVVWLLGPYASHMTALANVPRAERLLREVYPCGWPNIGTASRPDTVRARFGR